MYDRLYMIFMVAIGAAAIYFLKSTADYYKVAPKVRFKKNRFDAVTDFVKEQLYKEEMEAVFSQSGFNISGVQYQLIRYGIAAVWFLALIYKRYYLHISARNGMVLLLILFFATSPRMKINQYSTPFDYFISFFTSEHRLRKNKEIYNALLQLKNLSIAQASDDIGAIFIIEEISKYTKITRPIFTKFLSMWYENKKVEAAEYFSKAVDTKEGRELADVFLKIDSLSPSEIRSQLLLYLDSFNEERQTQYESRNERISNLFYFIVIMTVLAVFVNLIIIVLVIDNLNLYKTLVVH